MAGDSDRWVGSDGSEMALYRQPFIQDCADRDRCHSPEPVVNWNSGGNRHYRRYPDDVTLLNSALVAIMVIS